MHKKIIYYYSIIMDDSGIMAIVAVIVSVGGTIMAIFNHKRIRSKCCSEKEIVVSVDVETTTPEDLKIKIPPKPDENEKAIRAKDILYSV